VTVLVVHAIVRAERRLGEDQAGLSLLRVGPVGVVYAPGLVSASPDRADVLAFGRVVTALAEDGPVLPVRYGTVATSVEELRELAESRAETWAARLAELDGLAEMVVQVRHRDEEPEPEPATSGAGSVTGRDYLLAKAAAHRRTEERVEALRTAVAPRCRDLRVLSGDDGRPGVRVAVLLPTTEVAGLVATLDAWAAGQRDAPSVRVTGPWPPFSFAEEAS